MREWIDEVPRTGADRAAFAEVVNHYAPRLRDLLSRTGASEAAIEEAAQAVLTALWHDRSAASDPFGREVSARVFALAARHREALLGASGPLSLDPAAAFATSDHGTTPMPSLAAVEAKLQRIQEQLRRARQRQGRQRAA